MKGGDGNLSASMAVHGTGVQVHVDAVLSGATSVAGDGSCGHALRHAGTTPDRPVVYVPSPWPVTSRRPMIWSAPLFFLLGGIAAHMPRAVAEPTPDGRHKLIQGVRPGRSRPAGAHAGASRWTGRLRPCVPWLRSAVSVQYRARGLRCRRGTRRGTNSDQRRRETYWAVTCPSRGQVSFALWSRKRWRVGEGQLMLLFRSAGCCRAGSEDRPPGRMSPVAVSAMWHSRTRYLPSTLAGRSRRTSMFSSMRSPLVQFAYLIATLMPRTKR